MLSLHAGDPRTKRVTRVIMSAAFLSVVIFGMGPAIEKVDASMFREIMQGFADLIPSLSKTGGPNPGTTIVTLSHALGLLIFSSGAVWAGYKASGPARFVLGLQLIVLSLIFQLLSWQFFKAAGHPISIATAIGAGCYIGRMLKMRDDERRQLEAKQIELKVRNEELQESRIALVKQDESDRRLLAADLHDQVLNDLRTIQKNFEAYVAEPKQESRDKINSMLKQTMTEIREIMDELCPVMLEEFGLSAAIEDRLDKVGQQAGFGVRFSQSQKAGDRLEQLSAVERQLLYRLVQESLNNICKHANASLVRIAIDEENQQLIFRITDNGKGIDPSRLSESSRGTLYMRLRAALIGAKVSWKQGPDGKGTTVEIRVHVQGSSS